MRDMRNGDDDEKKVECVQRPSKEARDERGSLLRREAAHRVRRAHWATGSAARPNIRYVAALRCCVGETGDVERTVQPITVGDHLSADRNVSGGLVIECRLVVHVNRARRLLQRNGSAANGSDRSAQAVRNVPKRTE